jgi:hypothetical protein
VGLKDCLSDQWAAAHGAPLVAVELDDDDASLDGKGRIVGYNTSISSLGHGVGSCDEVMARIHYALTQRTSPERRTDDIVMRVIGRLSPALLRWALTRAGLRLQRQTTLMCLGDYAEPSGGAYSPSIMY